MKIKFLLIILLLFVAGCSADQDNDTATMTDSEMSDMDMNAPDGLDTATEKMSDNGLFLVSVKPLIDPIEINTLHSWQLTLLDKNDQPVEGATITVGGGMPEHNHGFPTQPQVVMGDQAGDYVIEGVKMQMAGWWEMKLTISAEDDSDTVTFNVVLP